MAKKPKNTEANAAEAVTANFEVLTPIRHDGDDYAVGETIELTQEQADALLAVQAVQAVKALPVAPKAATAPADQQPAP